MNKSCILQLSPLLTISSHFPPFPLIYRIELHCVLLDSFNRFNRWHTLFGHVTIRDDGVCRFAHKCPDNYNHKDFNPGFRSEKIVRNLKSVNRALVNGYCVRSQQNKKSVRVEPGSPQGSIFFLFFRGYLVRIEDTYSEGTMPLVCPRRLPIRELGGSLAVSFLSNISIFQPMDVEIKTIFPQ